jgi:hypothetical protein
LVLLACAGSSAPDDGLSKEHHVRGQLRKWELETWHIIVIAICICVAVGLVLGGILGVFSN